jgi:hypothetical protein
MGDNGVDSWVTRNYNELSSKGYKILGEPAPLRRGRNPQPGGKPGEIKRVYIGGQK